MKKILFMMLLASPLALFANDTDVQTDILERTVNFFIFIAILYYLLADKIKTFLTGRTKSIQAELDKVQEIVKESEKKVIDAKQEIENAKRVADELVSSANNDIEAIKRKIEVAMEQDIATLSKSFDEKTEFEAKRVKVEVIKSVLDQLLTDENIDLTQEELSNIILKKVA